MGGSEEEKYRGRGTRKVCACVLVCMCTVCALGKYVRRGQCEEKRWGEGLEGGAGGGWRRGSDPALPQGLGGLLMFASRISIKWGEGCAWLCAGVCVTDKSSAGQTLYISGVAGVVRL